MSIPTPYHFKQMINNYKFHLVISYNLFLSHPLGFPNLDEGGITGIIQSWEKCLFEKDPSNSIVLLNNQSEIEKHGIK